jgi:hypothetical protein
MSEQENTSVLAVVGVCVCVCVCVCAIAIVCDDECVHAVARERWRGESERECASTVFLVLVEAIAILGTKYASSSSETPLHTTTTYTCVVRTVLVASPEKFLRQSHCTSVERIVYTSLLFSTLVLGFDACERCAYPAFTAGLRRLGELMNRGGDHEQKRNQEHSRQHCFHARHSRLVRLCVCVCVGTVVARELVVGLLARRHVMSGYENTRQQCFWVRTSSVF